MLLKRLELQGFKSFADKTTLDLTHRVTAIVGPNGSGKSNITDSVRWLLGERDARNLRGGKGEDLIFAGTKDKPRAGMAQATLYFDNSSGALPVEYKDLAISRKVTREGVSIFTLNKSEIRLKDVIEFFAKSKLGARGLTIISQGESDMFIKATPQERREMIEEILGLKEYQLKKGESLRKLRNTASNLDKANALIEELKPHLKLLRRQVSRYEGREEAEEELRKLENQFFGAQLHFLESDLGKTSKEERDIEINLKAERGKLEALRKALIAIKEGEPKSAKELEELRKEEVKLQGMRADLQIELGRAEARLELSKERGDFDPQKAKRALEEIRSIAEKLFAEESLDKVRTSLKKVVQIIEESSGSATGHSSDELEKDKKDLLEKLKAMDASINDIKKKEESFREGLEGFNKRFSESYEHLDVQQKKVNTLDHQKGELLIRKERLETKLEGLLEELKQIGRSADSLRVSRDTEVAVNGDEMRERMIRLRSQLASIGEIDENVVKEAKETEDRFEFLSGQVADLEKASENLEGLIQELDQKIHEDFTSAMGKINEEFSKLIKIVFGGGSGSMKLEKITKIKEVEGEESDGASEEVKVPGILVDVTLPKKRIKGLDVLSGGERALVSIAALFSLISVSSPPFLFLDEVDAALDERNAKRFGDIVKEFSKHTQFVIVTHNRATMEAADVLYGVTMTKDGTSKLVSLKLT